MYEADVHNVQYYLRLKWRRRIFAALFSPSAYTERPTPPLVDDDNGLAAT
jgi:hypothetical protein